MGTSRTRLGVAALGAVRGGADRQALPAVRRDFPAHCETPGKKIATTVVARMLASRAWHLLTDAEHTAAPPPAAPANSGAVTAPGGAAWPPGELEA
jgi:hypothetical protein